MLRFSQATLTTVDQLLRLVASSDPSTDAEMLNKGRQLLGDKLAPDSYWVPPSTGPCAQEFNKQIASFGSPIPLSSLRKLK